MTDTLNKPSLSRRGVFAGAGAIGAVAAAAVVLPKVQTLPPQAVSSALTPSAQTQTGGYQLTEHVQRYYQTARV